VTGELPELLDRAPCGFISFGDDGRIVLINATLLDRLGYKRGELTSQHVDKILTPGSSIFHQTHFFPLVKLHGRAQEIFMLLRAKSGDDVGVLCNAVRRERDGGFVTDCVMMEVQERRKFEDALLQAKQTAERANAAADEANLAKSNFLAVMSHELRTPLNAIGGYVQLLQMEVHGPVTEAQQVALDRIDRSQRHLLRLINDVLNLSRIEAGHVDYRIEDVSIEEVVESVLPMVEPQIESKNLHLEMTVPVGIRACADREKVQQIVLNLLTNAIKFTSPGGMVEIESITHDNRVLLRVVDTGVGIPDDMLEKVFHPFIQVDSTRSRSAEGTGLGLAISRDLARGMKGDLSAQSKVGEGSSFQLELPRSC
jgi:signal transduction histidine kinase